MIVILRNGKNGTAEELKYNQVQDHTSAHANPVEQCHFRQEVGEGPVQPEEDDQQYKQQGSSFFMYGHGNREMRSCKLEYKDILKA